jgi:hypothetical protein
MILYYIGDEKKMSGDRSSLIIGVILGTVVIGLVVCVVILIVKLRRLLDLKGINNKTKC